MTLTEKEVEAILISLEAIEVHGFENMNKLMGCIAFLRDKQKQEKGEDNGNVL